MEKANMPEDFYELSVNEQQILVNWCKQLDKIKTFNKWHNSYNLKHIFEFSENGFYVTNGAFKQAMILAGFNYRKQGDGTNWIFNISEKSVKKLR